MKNFTLCANLLPFKYLGVLFLFFIISSCERDYINEEPSASFLPSSPQGGAVRISFDKTPYKKAAIEAFQKIKAQKNDNEEV